MAAVHSGYNRLAAVSHEMGLRIQFNKNLMSISKRKIPCFFTDIKRGYYICGDVNMHTVYVYSAEKKQISSFLGTHWLHFE